MNNIRNVESITEQELKAGIFGGLSKGSWHEEYKNSAWVFLGGFPVEITEGDIICVMSQWGEIEDINLVRDKVTNKSKGFAFIKYEDNRSTILAVDNFNGTTLLKRTLRCDHVQEYRLPKEVREKEMEALEEDPDAKVDIGPGHAYKNAELATEHDVSKGVDLWRKEKEPVQTKSRERSPSDDEERHSKKSKHEKKEKKEKSEKKHEKDKKHKHDKDDRRDGDRGADRSAERSRDRSDARRREHSRDTDYDRSDRASATAAAPAAAAAAVARGNTSVAASSSSFQSGAAASWRGNRDPVVATAPSNGSGNYNSSGGGSFGNKRPYEGNGSRESGGSGSASSSSRPRGDNLTSGIGGYNRVR